MKTFILILTTLLTLPVENYSQSKSDLEIYYDSIFSTEELLNLNDLKFKKYRAVVENSQDLNLDVIQTNWSIKHKRKYQRINLLTLSVDNKIFYYEITTPELREDLEGFNVNVLKTKIDTAIFNTLNQLSREIYSADINLDHLERLPHRSIFGYACYGSGQMPKEGLKMQQMIKNKDYKLLDLWLRSINPIKQAYAVLGFRLLTHKNIIEISQDQSILIDKVIDRDLLLYSCSGCTFWDFVPANSLLTENEINRFIQRLEK